MNAPETPDDSDGPPEADVPSPCVGICVIGGAGHCIGCLRTLDELQRWWTSTPAAKRAILDLCRQRERFQDDDAP